MLRSKWKERETSSPPPPPEAETIIIEMIEMISHFARTVSLSLSVSLSVCLPPLPVSESVDHSKFQVSAAEVRLTADELCFVLTFRARAAR